MSIHVAHSDEFEGDEDYWITVGEFRAEDLARALLPPTPAAKAPAHTAPQEPIRRHWRRKKNS